MTAAADAGAAVGRAFRAEGPAVLATLARHLDGDVGLAEDALQDALADALVAWPRDGVPRRPGAWMTTAARRRAIDRLRRERGLADRAARIAHLQAVDATAAEEEPEESPVEDDRLRLIYTCCHPALPLEGRVALTLRLLGGLSTPEIARAFLVPEPTMARRLSRAKAKIAAAGIPYRVPGDADLPERTAGVLAVLYLVFNEGYAATSGDRLVRADLSEEAIRLARLVAALRPDDGEAHGLLALMLLTAARFPARAASDGTFVPLDAQDRTRWRRDRIDEGAAILARASALPRGAAAPVYLLQAAIAAVHDAAPSAADTDWAQIAVLYGELARVAPSPVVEVNRAVAVGYAAGAAQGLRVLAPLLTDGRLRAFAPLHAAHAELLARDGRPAAAYDAYGRAIDATDNAVERAELARRRATIGRPS